MFQVAQLLGSSTQDVSRWSPAQLATIEAELEMFDSLRRRRVLQRAYERRSRRQFLDALASKRGGRSSEQPSFQVVFCIDEREESLRRHLEEVEPKVETYGAPGYFGVAMYFEGETDARPRPLCPVSLEPEHFVTEVRNDQTTMRARIGRFFERSSALLGKNIHLGSGTLFRGAVIMALLGVLWVIPRVLRVLFPWLTHSFGKPRHSATSSARTRLGLERQQAAPPIGKHTGFSVDEMARIVERQLVDMGLDGRCAPLVFVLGHASSSLNNPHESAHDCGACGGGRGGPNARAFAQMANDPRVRAKLATAGVRLSQDSWFVGGERNTASSQVTLFDLDLVPTRHRSLVVRARASLERARARDAHERCRRFDGVPDWLPPRLALAHAEARSADLAQPRPEYGHATNAFCVIGRRSRTRGLFLDRRCFLVSYDPSSDGDGTILARVIAGVVPVVAGINLEYFFGYVDPSGYGSGTKLPHNVAGLLGVMDGGRSDLRTGLPWQMLEIHEPVRLTVVVEASAERLRQVVKDNATLRRLVEHAWLYLGALDPDSNQVVELTADGSTPYACSSTPPRMQGDSLAYYRGRREHLAPVWLEASDAAELSA